MFGSASQEGEQADQLYFGMLGSLIAFLWSAAEYLLYFLWQPLQLVGPLFSLLSALFL